MGKVPFTPYDFLGYLASGVLLVSGMDRVLGFPEVIGRQFTVFETAAILLMVYVAGQLIATPAKAILEDRIAGRLLGPPAMLLLGSRKPRVLGFVFPGYYAPLPNWARKIIHEKAKGLTGGDLFSFIRFAPSMVGSEQLQARLAVFLNQYGFSRNLSFTSMLVGLALLLGPAFGAGPGVGGSKYGTMLVIAGVLLFYRFLKFYRQYCSELFLTYARTEGG